MPSTSEEKTKRLRSWNGHKPKRRMALASLPMRSKRKRMGFTGSFTASALPLRRTVGSLRGEKHIHPSPSCGVGTLGRFLGRLYEGPGWEDREVELEDQTALDRVWAPRCAQSEC